MCDCIKKIDAAMLVRNTCVKLPMFGPQRPFVETDKVDSRTRGKPVRVFANFCPFCGAKYGEDTQ